MHTLQKHRKRIGKVISTQDAFLDRATREFEEYFENAPNKLKFRVVDKEYMEEGTIVDLSVVYKEKQGDEKALLTRNNTKLLVGDTIEFIDSPQFKTMWLVHSIEARPVDSHRRYNLREINYSIDFEVNNEVFRLPCQSANGSLYYTGQEIGERLRVGNKVLTITVGQELKGSRMLFKGLRFLNKINGAWEAYEITSISDTVLGQLTVQAIETRIKQEDDLVKGLAYNKKFNLEDDDSNSTFYEILGDNIIEINKKYEYYIETNLEENVDFEIDTPEFAEVKKLSNKMCLLTPKKSNEYITLIAKCGEITIKKSIYILGGDY
ncbi:MAG: hypothetical protein KHZ90_09940 [Veillonella parvula]|uniref:Uncharacterized protein n=1 Tax=Veillonella parvula TaxID=29466 RepID=A0A942WPS7_VEIPA|nr:hypothetical protein [Veillonella parvula]MBS4894077.1 hypothetical protein [Veillonella parvula]